MNKYLFNMLYILYFIVNRFNHKMKVNYIYVNLLIFKFRIVCFGIKNGREEYH